MQDTIEKIRAMTIWQGEFHCEPLSGGLTNLNFLVRDVQGKYVVRLGEDIVEHHVLRFNELAASHAAHLAGLSPEVVFSQPGKMVLKYVESKTYAPQDVRQPENLTRIAALIRKCHREVPKHLRGPVMTFNVFHIMRDYAHTLREGNSQHLSRLDGLMAVADIL